MTASNTYGRQVVLPLTNKSGGAVAAGDVVVIDTANNDSFTTSTAGAFLGMIGIATGTIASNAVGLVLISGYASLVNVDASVIRGNYGKTHTVAKQATDAGASRVTGGFCQFLTGGTTPDAHVFGMADGSSASGNVATDAIWDAPGDLVQGTGANTAAKLTVGATGKVPTVVGGTLAYAYPPGYELDYVGFTATVGSAATTEATADTVVTASPVAFDGSTIVEVTFFSPDVTTDGGAAGRQVNLWLYDGSSSIGKLARVQTPAAGALHVPVMASRRLTPSNASHTYSVRSSVSAGTGFIDAGAGGTGNLVPGFIRITRV